MARPVAPFSYRFGHFELQAAERRLLVSGKPVRVSSRAFDVLVTLVERPGQLVSIHEIFERVWARQVVEENNLNQQITKLRKLLGSEAIVNERRHGYRFVLPVVAVTASVPAPLIAADASVDSASLETLDPRRCNLPHQLTSFIGREKEITELKELFSRTRLLTLVGSGGCGKTRLALQVATDLLSSYPDGVWLVELAPLSDPGLVPQTVVTVLGRSEEGGKSPTQTLIDYLEAKHLLLVFDNAEHLVSVCAQLSNALLRQCPQVSMLVTSREKLGMAGELTYRVPSLSTPDPDGGAAPEHVSQYESVRLFMERAQFRLPQFKATNKNARVLASIAYRLDGIPLALELAAARVDALSVEAIAERLSDRFQLLTGGDTTRLPRQQTLRACIDWSYDQLTEPERALLLQLAVFAGGWTLHAAEAVGTAGEIRQPNVLELLTHLVDKSLVEFDPTGVRYRLLETVRQYATENLAKSGGADAARERHCDYFLRLAEEAADAQPTGKNLLHWSPLLHRESDNLRTALRWSIDEPTEAQAALRLCGALRSFWWRWGRAGEGRGWCSSALERASDDSDPTKALVDALVASGTMEFVVGDLTAATGAYERALLLSRRLRERTLEGVILRYMANVKMTLGHTELARSLYRQSAAIHRALGDFSPEATSLTNLATLMINEGQSAQAQAPLERAITLSQQLGDLELEAYNVSRRGLVAQYQSEHVLASILHERSLSIARELGMRELELEQVRHLGEIAVGCREFEKARALFRESLGLARDQDSWFHIRECLDAIVALATESRCFEVAAELCGAVEHLRLTMAAPRFRIDQQRFEANRAQCRTELGTVRYESAVNAGAALQVNGTIAAAMAWLEHG